MIDGVGGSAFVCASSSAPNGCLIPADAAADDGGTAGPVAGPAAGDDAIESDTVGGRYCFRLSVSSSSWSDTVIILPFA